MAMRIERDNRGTDPVRAADASAKQRHHRAVWLTFADLSFLHRALAKVEQRLAADPDDADKLRQMGDLQRKLGDFNAASETYRKLRALDENAVAAWWMCALNGGSNGALNGGLNGEKLPACAPEEIHPAPFVLIPDFLTAAQRNVLFEAVRKGPEHVAPAWINYGGVVHDARAAFVAESSIRRQIRPWFMEEVDRVAGDVFEHFRIDDMREYRAELTVTAYQGGGFCLPHRDSGHTRFKRTNSRLISFSYYFHREPKGFAGGELLLYDTSIAKDDFAPAVFSRIEPINNSLVFFPSDYFHEVLPVHAASDAFESGRFTVTGWLHPRASGSPSGASGVQGAHGNGPSVAATP